jgi:ribonuclease R
MDLALAAADEAARDRLLRAVVAAGREGYAAAATDRAALEALERTGEAVSWDGRWFDPRRRGWIVGSLEEVAGGAALLRSGARGEVGFEVSRRDRGDAVDGDLVVCRPKERGPARGTSLPRAAVLRVLDRPARTAVGVVASDGERTWVEPFDAKAEPVELSEANPDAPSGTWVVATLEPGRPGGALRGRVTEVLGAIERPGTDVLVLLRHHRIPEAFPPAVLAAAAQAPAAPGAADLDGREDLRAALVVTIDGESARDFDDALSLEPLSGGGFRLGVHIADVAHYVREGTPLDREAYRRGTSVYFPERAVPMLPEALSNGLCSLRPGEDRLTMSAFLDVDAQGAVVGRRFAPTVIRSARRLTYAEVRRVLEEPAPGDATEYGAVLSLLTDLATLMRALWSARDARGSLDFDLPEGDVVLDTDGVTVGVRPEERTVAHRIVEEAMIAANEAVAFELWSHECPALYRVHDPPSRRRLEELAEILAPLGIRLPSTLESLAPSALQEVVRAVVGRAEGALVSALVLRSVERAIYSPDCRGHYALASRYYTHFTSPIRRYPDLVVHRRLKALLAGTAVEEARRGHLEARLPILAAHTSETERRAEQAERELLQWKKVRFLAGRVGERFSGRITGAQPFGLFVQLDHLFVDGLVPIRTLADDYYLHDPAAHRLVGRDRGRVFQLAGPIDVVLVGVDPRHRGLDLKVEGMPEPRTRTPRPPRGRR